MSILGFNPINKNELNRVTSIAKNKMVQALPTKIKNKYEDEDMALWHRYKGGDMQAKWALLDRFKGTVAQFTRKFSNNLPPHVVEAKLKSYVIEGFATYNPNKGTKLSTHVYNYLQQINRDNYKHQQAIRLPENLAREYTRYHTAKAKLHESLGREATTQELADYMKWSPEAIARAESKYHTELVEGKQEFNATTKYSDTAQTALRFAYEEMSDEERFLMEHKIGYMGKRILPAGAIKDQLKVTPHKFNMLNKSVADKVSNAFNTLAVEEY